VEYVLKYFYGGTVIMISNQILQSTIDGLKKISRIDFSILDTDGKCLVTTITSGVKDQGMSLSGEGVIGAKKVNIETYSEEVAHFVASPADSQVIKDNQYFKVFDERHLEYIILAHGDREEVYMIGKMVAFQVQSLIKAYKERFDKDNFVKNLLLDNLLLVDIYNRAKKLHIDTKVRRIIFIIETSQDKDSSALEQVCNVLVEPANDFVTAVDEKNIIVVKRVGEKDNHKSLEKLANKMLVHLKKAFSDNSIHIAYGTIVNDISEVSKSYKEAKLALDVGRIFFEDKEIVAYSTLGIGRLIYQLPIPLCKMYIKEIFEGKSPDDFDDETLTTIKKFFENSLNVSETSRQLYIHRNTLVYRLDKLQKVTGLDLRVFEDAITFKIALMVVKYMKYMESMEF
jgi:carbohydrate diacid regulator